MARSVLALDPTAPGFLGFQTASAPASAIKRQDAWDLGVRHGFASSKGLGRHWSGTAEADALATAFYLRGAEWADEYCKAHPEVAAVMSSVGQGQGGVTSTNGGRLNIQLRPRSIP